MSEEIPISESRQGVVVESVAGWTLEDAGVKPGDVLLSWTRLPSPPANPEPAEGVLDSYFDWLEMVTEQAPRGTVVLVGHRDGEPREFVVKPGLWEAEVCPVLPWGTGTWEKRVKGAGSGSEYQVRPNSDGPQNCLDNPACFKTPLAV